MHPQRGVETSCVWTTPVSTADVQVTSFSPSCGRHSCSCSGSGSCFDFSFHSNGPCYNSGGLRTDFANVWVSANATASASASASATVCSKDYAIGHVLSHPRVVRVTSTGLSERKSESQLNEDDQSHDLK